MKGWPARLRHYLVMPLAAPLIALVAAGLYCVWQGGCPLLTPDQQGYRAFEAGDPARAAARFSDPRWRAAALYRQGEFEQAAAMLAGFDAPEDRFNRANALAMLGRYQEAAALYEQVLEQRPQWEPARRNLDIALSRARALEQGRGETPGTELGADEIVFSSERTPPRSGDEQGEATPGGPGDADLRAVWLRQVQTRPADFLRARFAHQWARQQQEGKQ